jgi:hypothetical protein
MPSSKTLAKAILEKNFAKGDQKEIMSMLVKAADAGRADQLQRVLKSLSDQRDMIAQKRREVSREDRLKRLKLIQSMRTIDAMIELLGGGK